MRHIGIAATLLGMAAHQPDDAGGRDAGQLLGQRVGDGMVMQRHRQGFGQWCRLQDGPGPTVDLGVAGLWVEPSGQYRVVELGGGVEHRPVGVEWQIG